MPRILLADDNQSVRFALKNILAAKAGWDVCGEAADGAQAIDLVARLQPDLILLDFRMPVINGLDAAKEIIKNNPSVPVALYSLNENASFEEHARTIGVRRVMSKTDLVSSLIDTLAEILIPTKGHFHICWNGKHLDWERHTTRDAAEASATDLVRESEQYSIQEFTDDDCPRCKLPSN